MSEPIRFLRLAYIALDVSDVLASAAFYRDLVGLEQVVHEQCRILLRCSRKPFDLLLVQGKEPGLRRVSFEVESERDLAAARQRLEEAGHPCRNVSESEANDLRYASGLRSRVPSSGLEIELIVGFNDGAAYAPTVAKIERLGHVVVNTSEFGSALAFWTGTLNFAVSDAVPGRIAFLRCFPNKFHHSLALIGTPRDGYNHVNFMVSDIDDIGRGMNRMKKADVPIVFGPGRHEPSGSIFLYFLDPDGMTAEYSFVMEEFDESDPRPPRDLEPKPEVLDTWGSVPDVRFARTGAILPAEHG